MNCCTNYAQILIISPVLSTILYCVRLTSYSCSWQILNLRCSNVIDIEKSRFSRTLLDRPIRHHWIGIYHSQYVFQFSHFTTFFIVYKATNCSLWCIQWDSIGSDASVNSFKLHVCLKWFNSCKKITRPMLLYLCWTILMEEKYRKLEILEKLSFKQTMNRPFVAFHAVLF